MAEIVNLRRARKEKARSKKDGAAAANRARFGRPASERISDEAQKHRALRELEAHRLEKPEEN